MTTEPIRNKIIRWAKRVLKWMLILIAGYCLILLVGLFPVNKDFQPTPDGIKIYIVSNSVHADIILPKTTAACDWTKTFEGAKFPGDISQETHVAIGWGDRGFFLETKTWDDFKLSTAASALLLPSKSCAHVSFVRPEYFPNATSVSVSNEQFERLIEFAKKTFKKGQDGNFIQIEGESYSTNDAFFEAHSRYHVLNTCNSWAGRGLKSAGVKTPWLSPLPKTPMLYLKDAEEP